MDIDKLKKIAEAATPGPWYATPHPECRGANWRVGTRPSTDWVNFGQIAYMSGANARFVAAFNPRVALELLDEITRLNDTVIHERARIATLEETLSDLVLNLPQCVCSPEEKENGTPAYYCVRCQRKKEIENARKVLEGKNAKV